MKTFEYIQAEVEEENIARFCNDSGEKGYELVSCIPKTLMKQKRDLLHNQIVPVYETTFILIFKKEIFNA